MSKKPVATDKNAGFVLLFLLYLLNVLIYFDEISVKMLTITWAKNSNLVGLRKVAHSKFWFYDFFSSLSTRVEIGQFCRKSHL
jgi:hypothetical protein